MKYKNKTTIRVNVNERDMWREYCKLMGESSPKLFSKILTSKDINLNQRILNELKRKEDLFKKRLLHE